MSITIQVARRRRDGHMIVEVKWGPKDKINISCALRAINVPKFIIDCEVYSARG